MFGWQRCFTVWNATVSRISDLVGLFLCHDCRSKGRPGGSRHGPSTVLILASSSAVPSCSHVPCPLGRTGSTKVRQLLGWNKGSLMKGRKKSPMTGRESFSISVYDDHLVPVCDIFLTCLFGQLRSAVQALSLSVSFAVPASSWRKKRKP